MKTIAIIDNDETLLEVMGHVLSNEGYQVSLSMIATPFSQWKFIPDLIIVDDCVNYGTGYDLCKALKNDPLTQAIPVIFTSTDHNIHEVALNCEADLYLAKPFNVEDLIGLVKQFVPVIEGTS
jgi:two-component system response regulator VicR